MPGVPTATAGVSTAVNSAVPGAAPARPSNLTLRLATAAIGIPLLLAVVLLGGWAFAVAAGVIVALATIEYVHGFLFPSRPIREVWQQAQVAGIAVFAVAAVHQMPELSFFTAGLAVLLIAAGLTPLRQLGPRKPMRVQGAALIYLAVPGSLLVLLRDLDGGRDWLLLTIFGSFAVDTGAYAVGRLIGRHKLAPKISPKKTIEGAAGGYLLGAAAVVALVTLLNIDAGAVAVAAMAVLLPPVAMAGDLLESWLKRRMGVKDASGLLPGHGGLMDRLDSVLPVGVLVYTVAQLA